MAYLLFPGRHLVNTRFQEEYLFGMLQRPIADLPVVGETRPVGQLNEVIFAVTSSNKQNSRYNPVPFHLRAIGVDRFARRLQEALQIGFWIVGVPHSAPTGAFADHTLKEIHEQTEGALDLTPENTVVLCSTPAVARQYQALGFSLLLAELDHLDDGPPAFRAPQPIALVQRLAEVGEAWATDELLRQSLSPASFSLLSDFPELPRRIARLYRDPLLNEQGSLTETRNYNTYARAMESIITLKYDEIRPGIVPGKIVDEGCADGALLVKIAHDFPDSDLIGIDIATEFIARCQERQRGGEFGGTFVYFHQRNLLEPVFEPGTIDTTICNSTLHELWSYGDREATLHAYFEAKFAQCARGGRLVIRDVVGFDDKEGEVFLVLDDQDGANDDPFRAFPDAQALADYLRSLSTRARFYRFARDFLAAMRTKGKRGPETAVRYEAATVDGRAGFRVSLRYAMEFITKKDYPDNWDAEMNEEFCFWSFAEWKAALQQAGFRMIENPNEPEKGSRAYTSAWRVANHFQGKATLYRETASGLESLPYPETNQVLIAEKA